MKEFFVNLFLLILAVAIMNLLLDSCNARGDEMPKRYYRFSVYNGEILTYETAETDEKAAFEKAAMACFNHFKGNRHLGLDEGQDIIDVCVNPRSVK